MLVVWLWFTDRSFAHAARSLVLVLVSIRGSFFSGLPLLLISLLISLLWGISLLAGLLGMHLGLIVIERGNIMHNGDVLGSAEGVIHDIVGTEVISAKGISAKAVIHAVVGSKAVIRAVVGSKAVIHAVVALLVFPLKIRVIVVLNLGDLLVEILDTVKVLVLVFHTSGRGMLIAFSHVAVSLALILLLQSAVSAIRIVVSAVRIVVPVILDLFSVFRELGRNRDSAESTDLFAADFTASSTAATADPASAGTNRRRLRGGRPAAAARSLIAAGLAGIPIVLLLILRAGGALRVSGIRHITAAVFTAAVFANALFAP